MSAEILRLSNFDSVNQSARSEVASSASATQTIVTLQSVGGFVDEGFIVIAPATECAEIRQIDAINGNALTLKTALTFSHQPGTTVLQLMGDQLKVNRASNIDGSEPVDFTAHPETSPSNPVTIQPDQRFTAVTDPDGGSGYWYKVTYLNSVTSTETDLSLSLAVRGGDYGHYASLEEIRDEAGFSLFDNVTDQQVSLARAKAESEINSVIASIGYTMPISVEVPLLASITHLLAAGHLLNRSYGSGAEGTTKDGARLLKDGRDLLKQLMAGTLQLVDTAGNVLPNTANSSGQSSGSVEGSCREPVFRMRDVF
jgi:hypothetical protein